MQYVSVNIGLIVQAMACYKLGMKRLPEPMWTYFQLTPWEETWLWTEKNSVNKKQFGMQKF